MPMKLKGYFANSIIGRWTLMICVWYQHSTSKKVAEKWKQWNKQSLCCKKWTLYINKKPRYLESSIFRWTQDRNEKTAPFFDGLHTIGKQSLIVSLFVEGKKQFEQGPWIYGSRFLWGWTLGYGVIHTFRSTWVLRRIWVFSLLLLGSLILQFWGKTIFFYWQQSGLKRLYDRIKN